MKDKKVRIGVDIGGVIIDEIRGEGGLAVFPEKYLEVPAVTSAFNSLRLLARRADVYLISKARADVEGKCRQWLHHNQFFEITGISHRRLHFCRLRYEKAEICTRYGIQTFVDDKAEVLSTMVGHVPRLFLFNPDRAEMAHYPDLIRNDVYVVRAWPELMAYL